jgi:hypothetical protein
MELAREMNMEGECNGQKEKALEDGNRDKANTGK